MLSQEKNKLKCELHTDWKLTHNETRLERDFKFKNFTDALEFCYNYGKEANKTKHHPDIHLSWQHCVVEIWTHDKNDLAPIDFELAKLADGLYPAK